MASKPTGASGTLIIDDIGGRVYFRIKNTQGATFTNDKPWSGTVNGVPVSGTFSIHGAETVTVGNWAVSSSQTVTFTMGATGTAGLGGPTTLQMAISRTTVPSAPGTPTVSNVTTDRATLTWAASSGGGLGVSRYGIYIATDSGFTNQIFGVWSDAEESYRLPAGTLDAGKKYFARIRAENGNGTGPYSGVREFWSVPATPSGLTATRVSDSQLNLAWTRNSTYTSVIVHRSTNDGAWQQVGVAAGNASTFTDKSSTGNRKYEYRVAGVAGSAQSGWSGLATVYTSPAAPTGISAERSGNNITVSASGVPPYADLFDVRDGATVIASAVSLPYTHVAPNPAVAHTYTVRAVRFSPNVVASGWSSPSNTVQLVAPPNAPANLAPNGVVWASDTDVLFKWKHNPVDSSPQSAFELQYRVDGGAWVTVTGTTVQQASVALDVSSVDWQVRTKGSHPDWSPWSPVATFTIIDRPGVAVVQPADTWDASILLIEWTWFQAQGRPQSAWRYELLDAGNHVVEARNGSGALTAPQATTRLTEGMWTVRAQAATGEVWSLWATETFTVTFDPPGAPVISGEWDETQGGVQLAVAGEAYGVAVLTEGVWYAEIGE